MRRLHRIFGVLIIFAFLLTGQFMEFRQVGEMDDGARMMFRSRHIYILLAGLINLGVGVYFISWKERWRRVLQSIGSMLLIAAPLLLLGAFFYETTLTGLQRTLTLPALLALILGIFCHLFSGARSNKDSAAI
jgi:peptidoglycan/LPS O-acetylase OafA/YrhL